MRITFIGLGVMGAPMAGHLSRAGHSVTVYNRTEAKARAWCRTYNGTLATAPAEAAAGAEAVILCVGNDSDVRTVVSGDNGVLQAMPRGALLIDHTTTSAVLAETIGAEASDRGVQFVDAPVSGGQAGAESGQLTVMCGADESAFERAGPLLATYSKHLNRFGAAGQGQRAKMVNQLCIAGILEGLSEGVRLAEATGLDVSALVDTLQHGAADSWQLRHRAESMARGEFDFGFAIDWMHKDLRIAMDEGARFDLTLPVAARTDAIYQRLSAEGHGRRDTSALILSIPSRKDTPGS